MSKGSRKREANAQKVQKRLEREQFEAKKRKVRVATATVTIIVIIALVLGVFAGMLVNNIRLNRGEYLRKEIAASSAPSSIEVDGAMMNYFFNDTYNTFLSYYGSYLSYIGLDPSISLKQQMASETTTWFEDIMTSAKSTVSNVLVLNEAAKAAGTALSDAEVAAIKNRVDGINKKLYGRGTNKTDIYNAKLLEALAYKYQIQVQDELAPTDSEIDVYFIGNAKNFQTVDYLSFPLYFADPNGTAKPGRTQAKVITEDDVKAFVDRFAEVTTKDEFNAIVREVLLLENPDMTDEKISEELNKLETVGATYTKDNPVSEWAFAAKPGSFFNTEDKEAASRTVYFLTKEAYRDEAETVDVRHVLLYDDNYGSRAKALKAAEKLLADFNAAPSEEAFALLALEYSEDPGSYYVGGLYKNVKPGEMVESFNDWCFDDARKAGDTGIVESDYGVHIMYFVDDAGQAWAASVENAMISEEYEKLNTEWTKEYTVVYDENVLDSIPG